MADGVQVTAGSGTTIATDDTASGHVQVVKLAQSADSTATPVTATADGMAIIVRPETTANLSIKDIVDSDETEDDVKTSAGVIFGVAFWNNSTGWRYLKWYNSTAANVTVGTTTVYWRMGIPPGVAGHVSYPHGIPHTNAICVACTTGPADSDTGAPPTANEVGVQVFYK